MDGLTEGRIVHYVLANGEHRPAIVVKVWRSGDKTPENGCSNLQVFTDSDVTDIKGEAGRFNDNLPAVMWRTSVLFSEKPEPHTWHWIEKA